VITQYYYSIDSLFDCKRVALIYSPYLLQKENMPGYVVGQGMFAYETVITADENGVLSTDIIDVPDYDDFEFNNVLVLNETNNTVAFIRMDSPIKPAKYGTRKITVTFEYDVETYFKGGLVLTLDYHSHIGNERNVHKHLLSSEYRGDKVAMCKDDIYFIETDRNPYYAGLQEFAAASEGMMKYAGDLFYKHGGTTYKLGGNAFTYEGDDILGFVTLEGGVQALSYYYDGKVWAKTEDPDPAVLLSGIRRDKIEAVLDDAVIIHGDGNSFPAPGRNMYRVVDLQAGDMEPLPIADTIKYVTDAVTSRSMFYCVKDGNSINLEATSPELKRILEGLLIDSEEQPGELVAATDGLVVYRMSKGFLLCSCQSVVNGGDYPDRFLCECDDVCVLSNRAVLLIKKVHGTETEVWQVAELVNEGNEFRWDVSYFGQRSPSGCLFPSIYKIARRRTSTPMTDVAAHVSYKGLRYGFAHDGTRKQLISI